MGRYCDSRCLNAESKICTCRCGGANHGKGLVVELAPEPEPIDPELLARTKALAEKILADKLGRTVKL